MAKIVTLGYAEFHIPINPEGHPMFYWARYLGEDAMQRAEHMTGESWEELHSLGWTIRIGVMHLRENKS